MNPNNDDTKNCQIFTPVNIVDYMIDLANLKKSFSNIKILENSAGDGNFLVRIVDIIIPILFEQGLTKKQITEYLENNIHAFEISDIHYENCIRNLNNAAIKHNINKVHWSIKKEDFLKFNFTCKYDLIIGNPPYIQYKNLDKDDRLYIKKNFSSCSEGKPDYYYAFIQKSLNILNNNGQLVYLIPSNVFKNRFGNRIRELMIKNIDTIVDFQFLKLFDNGKRNTVSSIIKLINKDNIDVIKYIDYSSKSETIINKSSLEAKWSFEHYDYVEDAFRFGDFFNVNYSIATLCNEAYVIKETTDFSKKVLDKNMDKFVKKAASPRGLSFNKTEYIIFPYKFENDKYIVDSDFKKNKYLINYLKTFEDKLKKRKSDSNIVWYQYGRSQSLHTVNKNKLLMSTVITNSTKVFVLDDQTVPYSGIVITVKNNQNNISLNSAKRILESDSFMEYVKKIGLKTSTHSIRITSTEIENYRFEGDF